MECEGERALVLEYARKASPPPFLLKTYMLVEDPATDDLISWNADGTAFVVWQPAEFARDLLPTLFKHSNFSSFVRQLNTYGFHKVATNRWEFCNDMFRKGQRDRLYGIRRRKSSTSNKAQPNVQPPQAAAPRDKDETSYVNESEQRSSASASSSSSSELTTLVDENRRLKQENGALNSELAVMKKKCEELLHLVAIYGGKEDDRCSVEVEENSNKGPKLFGVRLMEAEGEMEKKRKREEISDRDGRIVLSQPCK